MQFRTTSLLTVALFLSTVLLTRLPAQAVDFSTEVRPILSQYCFKCHGPDEGSRQGDLRLDQRLAATTAAASGERAIVPGESSASELVQRILSTDPDTIMPPPDTKLTLSDEQKDLLKKWIDEGAEYRDHWAFVAPKKSPLPQVADNAWSRNAIDHFVLSALEKRGLTPSAESEPSLLLRRVYLDLIGLPPTPEQTIAYLGDPRPDRYERMVDQLLTSPAYGERWARRWLDLARYADTNGYEKDRQRSIYPYRQWVIDSINDDMPFDQFTIKQLAGDLLPNATVSDRIATGFHRNTMLNEEGGIDPLEFRFHAMVDRVGTTGTVWMGMSVACAQCHTHKYDPISQHEYYQLMAFLNNADEPELPVPDQATSNAIAAAKKSVHEWQSQPELRFPVDLPEVTWVPVEISTATAEQGSTLAILRDGTVLSQGNIVDKDTYHLSVKLPKQNGWITGVRIETLADGSLPNSGPGRAPNGNLVLSEFRARRVAPGAAARELSFSGAFANHSQTGMPPENALDRNDRTGWALDPMPKMDSWHASFLLSKPEYTTTNDDHTLEVDLAQQYGGQHLIGRCRVLIGWIPADVPQEQRLAEASQLQQRSLQRAISEWRSTLDAKLSSWKAVAPQSATANMAKLRLEEDAAIFAEGDQTKRDEYHLQFAPQDRSVSAILLEVLPDERLPKNGPGRTYYEGPFGDFFLSEVTAKTDSNAVAIVEADSSFPNGGAKSAIDRDPLTGWSINGAQGKRNWAVFKLAEPIKPGQAFSVDLLFERYHASPLGKFRVWLTDEIRGDLLPALPPEFSPSSGEDAVKQHVQAQTGGLEAVFFRTAYQMSGWRKQLEQLESSIPTPATTLVFQERPSDLPRPTYVHHRGEFLSPRDAVQPGTPSFLPKVEGGSSTNRLDFAKWLVRPDHPLTARVIVNRNWSLLFGRGFVSTEEDFGYQGSPPTHPELLDWLAREWVDGLTSPNQNTSSDSTGSWSLKRLHRLIVTSATYRQSSDVDSRRLELDPDNRWFSRGSRKRLEAEQVRDSLLTVSSLIDRKIGGPSVFPPQPASVSTEGAYGALSWQVSPGGDRYRRGLYTFMKRTAPYAMAQTFDGPSGEACLAKRLPSNTPLQALTMLNDVTVIDVAQNLARVTLAMEQQQTTEKALDSLFQRILVRSPDEQEHATLLQFVNEERERLKAHPATVKQLTGDSDNPQQAAWMLLARALLNTDEFLTRN